MNTRMNPRMDPHMNPCMNPSSCTGCPYQPPVVGMAYVPWQKAPRVYDPMRGFTRGTVFPELDKPFMAGGHPYGR